MKNTFFIICCFLLSISAATAQLIAPLPDSKVITDGPIISFKETKFDFGTIQEGDVVKHTFEFTNTGNQVLLISRVGVTCGCTTPDWTRTPIAPGKSGYITAQFNSSGKPGKNHKVITVYSNSVTGQVPLSFITTVSPRASADTGN